MKNNYAKLVLAISESIVTLTHSRYPITRTLELDDIGTYNLWMGYVCHNNNENIIIELTQGQITRIGIVFNNSTMTIEQVTDTFATYLNIDSKY